MAEKKSHSAPVQERDGGSDGEGQKNAGAKRLPSEEVSTPAELALLTYVSGVHQIMGQQGAPMAEMYDSAVEQVKRMQPRDSVEEVLISQMLMTHSRMLYLERLAYTQTNQRWLELIHTQADRAANTFRRQMETLAKYRKPRRRRRSSFTTIRTAHIHAKQILTQPQQSAVQPDRAQTETPPICEPGSQAAIAGADSAGETVVEEHGAEDVSG
jgi:hypothetical protein